MPKKSNKSVSRRLQGKVVSFNLSPKGNVEGVLVALESGTAQLNFHGHHGRTLSRLMPAGSTFELNATLDSEDGEHPVYLVDDADAEASGKVVRFNYALHGGVNGYHLDEGTFVHVKPKGAEKYQIEIGEHVHATGSRHPGADAVVLEASRVERRDVHRVASVSA